MYLHVHIHVIKTDKLKVIKEPNCYNMYTSDVSWSHLLAVIIEALLDFNITILNLANGKEKFSKK